jgi:hypothetical protein
LCMSDRVHVTLLDGKRLNFWVISGGYTAGNNPKIHLSRTHVMLIFYYGFVKYISK